MLVCHVNDRHPGFLIFQQVLDSTVMFGGLFFFDIYAARLMTNKCI